MENSFYTNLYLDLQKRINNKVPKIQWIEQDFGQDVYKEWRPAVAFPAVLIDFPDSNFEAMSTLHQFARVTISLRLLDAPFTQSYADAPIETKKDALAFFDLEHEIVVALHGWTPGYCQPLIRERATSNNQNNIGLRIREISFTTAYEEYFD